MTEPETQQLMALLATAYTNTAITAETVAVYAAMLADVDCAAARATVERHIKTARFFPTIAEIRDAPRRAVNDGGYITREKAIANGWIVEDAEEHATIHAARAGRSPVGVR